MSRPSTAHRAAATADYLDQRTGIGLAVKAAARKVFPDHWSFLLGEIALYSFLVLLITGVFLTLFFVPSMGQVTYEGPFAPMQGVQMSEAFRSTMALSFEVTGGLLMRQIHHWAAVVFIAAIVTHMMRVFFTGAFRKPREVNWVVGFTLMILSLAAGFTGYSLPDDVLSGNGLRITDGVVKSIPIIGSYLSYFIFGGEFPGDAIIPRLFTVHILLVPGLILALIGLHLFLVVLHKHTHYGLPGRTERNVVGYPLFPVYVAKAGGFFFIVFGVTALMGGLMTINPVWMYGPYNPSQVTAGSQPDWYMGVAEGLLRIMPGWETELLGFTISWNVLIPGVVAPGIIFTTVLLYPFIEAWITGDKREHHLLQRPRNAPVRTAFLSAMITLYGLLWAAGGNDILAVIFHLNLNYITYFMRVMIFVGPVIAFIIARRWCISLQRADENRLLHGYESGVIMRSPDGEYAERHLPISAEETYNLAAREPDRILEEPSGVDENGIAAPNTRSQRLRAKLSRFWFASNVQPPTAEELDAARHHAQHELEAHSDPTPADGHQFDGFHPIEGEELRKH